MRRNKLGGGGGGLELPNRSTHYFQLSKLRENVYMLEVKFISKTEQIPRVSHVNRSKTQLAHLREGSQCVLGTAFLSPVLDSVESVCTEQYRREQ